MNILINKIEVSSIFLILFISVSCSNKSPSVTSHKVSLIDSTSFPKVRYYSVALFSLDSAVKLNISNDSGTFIDTSVLEYVERPGYSFINKTGVPKTGHIQVYQLDSMQIRRLQIFLLQQPCKDSLVADKACVPNFRNVFVFYDENKMPIAEAHICFRCEMTYFNPRSDYMCDFDNKVDFNALRNFMDSIKRKTF